MFQLQTASVENMQGINLKRKEGKKMSSIINRMIRAAKLDPMLYEEVEANPALLNQAMAVVIISSVAAGIGRIPDTGITGLLLGAVMALFGWFVWALMVYLIGTRILPEPQTRSTPGELLRTIGFSSSPGVIQILGVIPFLAPIVYFVASVWMIAAMVIAVRQALDYKSTARAIGVCVIGWLIQLLVFAIAFSLFGFPVAPQQP